MFSVTRLTGIVGSGITVARIESRIARVNDSEFDGILVFNTELDESFTVCADEDAFAGLGAHGGHAFRKRSYDRRKFACTDVVVCVDNVGRLQTAGRLMRVLDEHVAEAQAQVDGVQWYKMPASALCSSDHFQNGTSNLKSAFGEVSKSVFSRQDLG